VLASGGLDSSVLLADLARTGRRVFVVFVRARLTKAAIFCARKRIGEIAMASLQSNPFPDARPQFFRAFERAVQLGMELPLRVTTPFEGLEKADVIRKGRALPLQPTLSCANPRGSIHCGACTKRAERIEGFHAASVPDPTRYARNRG
jgi:7-cyano-7-deazaguanine synthase